jgi:hypothetical protein
MAETNKIIKRETIQRLLKDVKQIIKHPLTDNGIYYSHDETDMLKGYAMIVGPADTPYFGGFYFFEFNFPDDYPFSPLICISVGKYVCQYLILGQAINGLLVKQLTVFYLHFVLC